MSELLGNLFSKPGPNNGVVLPKAHLLDAIRMDIANENNGVNVISLENTNTVPVFSNAFKNGDVVNVLDEQRTYVPNIFISSNPVQDSINLANRAHINNALVVDWNDPMFTMYRTVDDVNSRAHLVLDRFPYKQHSFVGLVQFDPMWNTQSARDRLVRSVYNGVTLYNNKSRQGVGHPHDGYEFFVGHHCNRQRFIRVYAYRKVGTSTTEEVSSLIDYMYITVTNYIYFRNLIHCTGIFTVLLTSCYTQSRKGTLINLLLF